MGMGGEYYDRTCITLEGYCRMKRFLLIPFMSAANQRSSHIVFIGKMSKENEIQMDRPKFSDALRLARFGFLSPMNSPYRFIPLTNVTKEHNHFYESLQKTKIKRSFNKRSIIIESNQEMIFHYLLIKNGKRVLLLVDKPQDSMEKQKTNQILTPGGKKKPSSLKDWLST